MCEITLSICTYVQTEKLVFVNTMTGFKRKDRLRYKTLLRLLLLYDLFSIFTLHPVGV